MSKFVHKHPSKTIRRSYGGLMKLPAWGLYVGDRLVASARAASAYDAQQLFRAHGLEGERVRRIP
jgi:metallophosphoesterase superfamily enzyme